MTRAVHIKINPVSAAFTDGPPYALKISKDQATAIPKLFKRTISSFTTLLPLKSRNYEYIFVNYIPENYNNVNAPFLQDRPRKEKNAKKS